MDEGKHEERQKRQKILEIRKIWNKLYYKVSVTRGKRQEEKDNKIEGKKKETKRRQEERKKKMHFL